MRSTLTPRMRATVGFCAVACICRPVRVAARNQLSATMVASATASTPSCASETLTPRSETTVSGRRVGKGCASAL